MRITILRYPCGALRGMETLLPRERERHNMSYCFLVIAVAAADPVGIITIIPIYIYIHVRIYRRRHNAEYVAERCAVVHIGPYRVL